MNRKPQTETRRQYERHETAYEARIDPHPDHAEQFRLTIPDAQTGLAVIDVSKGGVGLRSGIFLPRNLRVTLLISGLVDSNGEHLEVLKVRGLMRRCRLVDYRPTYEAGLQFVETQGQAEAKLVRAVMHGMKIQMADEGLGTAVLLEQASELRDQLLAERVLSPAEVDDAEKRAAEQKLPLGTILRKRGMLTETQLQALDARRQGWVYCNLSEFILRLGNSALIPEELARAHRMFPIFQLDGVITLVMEDPSDLAGLDQVRRLTKQEVDVCTAGKSDILGLIERAYGANRYLKDSRFSGDLVEASRTSDTADDQPVIRLVDDLINEAIRQNASDIHIEPGDNALRVRIRVDGVLREIAAPPAGLQRALVSRVKVLAKLDISQTRAPQDGAISHEYEGREVLLRVAVLPSIYGEAVVLRLLRNESESISLPELGMSSTMLTRIEGLIKNSHGMILVSGPTGSGKSTTLYAAMKCITSPQINIIAIEDPVEYRTSLIRQIQVNPDANLTFAGGLRSMLRQDPDVIMVGEIRDGETAQIAVQAALTGHLVLSTVHTNDSISAIVRFRDLGIAEYLISSSFLAVLAQRLCRKICPECKEPAAPPDHLLRAIGLDRVNLGFEPMQGKGCRRCVGSGYVGRTGIYELFELDDKGREMIAHGSSSEAMRQQAKKANMKFLLDDGIAKIREGTTTVEEVVRIIGRS